MSRTKRSADLAKHLWSYKRNYFQDFQASCIMDCYTDPGDMFGYRPLSRHKGSNLLNAYEDVTPSSVGKVKYCSQWK